MPHRDHGVSSSAHRRLAEESFNYDLRGRTVEELREEMNRILRQLSMELGGMRGTSGSPRFYGDLHLNGHRVTDIGMPLKGSDAQRLDLCLTHNGGENWDAKGRTIDHVSEAKEPHQAVTLSQLEGQGRENEVVFADVADIQPVKIAPSVGTSTRVPRADHTHHGTALLGMLGTDVAVTGTVAETTVYFFTVPANTLGLSRFVRLWAGLAIIGVGGGKTIRLKIGATTVQTIVLANTDVDPRWIEWFIMPAGATTLQHSLLRMSKGGVGNTFDGVWYDNVAENTALDLTIGVTVQLANAADTMGGRGTFAEIVT